MSQINTKGPAWLDPAALSAVVGCGLFLAFYYGNTTHVSAHLRKRLKAPAGDSDNILGSAELPTENKVTRRTRWALAQYVAGYLSLFAAAGFFLAFMWT